MLVERGELGVESLPLALLGADLDLERPPLVVVLGLRDRGFEISSGLCLVRDLLVRQREVRLDRPDRLVLALSRVGLDVALEIVLR